MSDQFSRVEEAIEAIAAGQIVIVLDSEDRENEGDFVMAAEKVTPQAIHFMISHGRGQLCVPVMPDVAQRLRLTPMVLGDGDDSMPRFTVPVDHRNCKTGISPLERAVSIQAMLDETSRAEDFLRPGHIFPLVAVEGGVLERPGHTEAATELARMAGLSPAGVLCEICSRDGMHMADLPELLQIAAEFGRPLITMYDLILYRRRCNVAAQSATAWASDKLGRRTSGDAEVHDALLATGRHV